MTATGSTPPTGYTASQWSAVRECDRHLLVAAGAGTGKTHTVVGKLLYLLGVPLGGHVHPSPIRLRDLAAITFTNQAAADLTGKLRDALRKAGRRDLAYEVDAARVGTIHGFCGDVLREFALRGRQPVGARVLDEGEGGALQTEAARAALLEALETDEISGLQELVGHYAPREVERWTAQLAGDADRLRRLTDGYDSLGARERALVRLASDAYQRLQAALHERGALDFDRMIVATRDLVRDEPSVRRALQRRIRALVVDEFQDVDPVQREIAYLLGGVEQAATDDAPATRLVLVGDPKQSIYRFRRADVSVWNQVERDFGERGRGMVVQLAENFRSVAPVLAFVEHGIGPCLDEAVDAEVGRQDFEVAFAPVRVTRHDPPAHAGVEFLVVPPREDGGARRMGEARALEAELVAERMLALRREHGVPWKEMAVLLTGWGALDVYQDALRHRGIPTYALRSEGFLFAREVVDLVLALRVARDPGDDQALLGFLRSPFVGVKDETLLALARSGHRPYWQHVASLQVADAAEQALVEHGLALVARHAALRDRMPAAQLLDELLAETGYLGHLALLGERGRQGIANVRQLLDDLRRRPDASVGELLRELGERRDRGDRVAQARLHGAEDDVVTITSVHSAKGMEWGAVFWCDLMRAASADSDKLLVGRDGLLLGDPEEKADDQSEEWKALSRRLASEAEAEHRRLWYVAATRAKDRLVLSGIAPGKGARLKGTPAAMLMRTYPALADGVATTLPFAGQDASFQAQVLLAVGASPDAPETGADTSADAALAAPADAVRVPLGRGRHSATSLMQHGRCGVRHHLRYVLGLPEPKFDEATREHAGGRAREGIAAVTRGQIVHDVLERLRADADVELLLESAIERWDLAAPARHSPAGAAYRAALGDEVRQVAEHEGYAALAALPTARRELGFLHVASEHAVVVGSMDLAAASGEQLVVLDVKTSAVEGQAAAERAAGAYAVQQAAYTAAAQALTGMPVARFVFHFSRGGVQVDGVPSAAAVDMEERLGACGAGGASYATDAAECGRCGYRAAGWCAGVEATTVP